MSVAGIADAAVARAIDRLTQAVAAEAPDVTVARVADGLRLAGPRLALRWLEDVRLRTLVASVARRLP